MRGPVRHNVEHSAHHRDHDLHVVGVVEVVHTDDRVGGGVGALEHDLALAVWLHRIGEHDHAFRVGCQSPGGVVEVPVGVDTQALLPDVRVVPTREEPDLPVVGVVVTEAGGEPRRTPRRATMRRVRDRSRPTR